MCACGAGRHHGRKTRKVKQIFAPDNRQFAHRPRFRVGTARCAVRAAGWRRNAGANRASDATHSARRNGGNIAARCSTLGGNVKLSRLRGLAFMNLPPGREPGIFKNKPS
jgi:hypothetical protein